MCGDVIRKSKKTRDELLHELRHAYKGGARIGNMVVTPASRTNPFTACCASPAPSCAAVAVPITILSRDRYGNCEPRDATWYSIARFLFGAS